MIHQVDSLLTKVQFGREGQGSVGLTATNGKLVLQQLINEVRIGQPFDRTKDISELPKVELNFTDVGSVDAMIRCLEKVRHFMEYPYPAYCYAC